MPRKIEAFPALLALSVYLAAGCATAKGGHSNFQPSWRELPRTSLRPDQAWQTLRKTVSAELGFTILTEENDYFITDWLNLDAAQNTSKATWWQPKVRLIFLKDQNASSPGLYRVEGASGDLPLDMRHSPYEHRVMAVLDEALAAAGKPNASALSSKALASAAHAPAPDRRRQTLNFSKADMLLARRNLKAAEGILEEMMRGLPEDDPQRIGCYRRLGTIAYREGNKTKAQSYFERGSRLAKATRTTGADSAASFLGLGMCLKAQGQKKRTVAALRHALDYAPDDILRRRILHQLRQLEPTGRSGE